MSAQEKPVRYIKRVDELGRVTLPIQLRRSLMEQPPDTWELFVNGSELVLKPYKPGCVFCGSLQELAEYRGQKVCQACKSQLARLAEPASGQLSAQDEGEGDACAPGPLVVPLQATVMAKTLKGLEQIAQTAGLTLGEAIDRLAL